MTALHPLSRSLSTVALSTLQPFYRQNFSLSSTITSSLAERRREEETGRNKRGSERFEWGRRAGRQTQTTRHIIPLPFKSRTRTRQLAGSIYGQSECGAHVFSTHLPFGIAESSLDVEERELHKSSARFALEVQLVNCK